MSSSAVRRIAPKEVRQATRFHEIGPRGPVKVLVLLFGALLAAPPEPASYVLVPRTEDDRRAFQTLQEVAQAHEPLVHEQFMELAAVQEGFHHPVGGGVPGVPARQRVPRMPGERDDAAALRMREDRLPDQAEIDAVQVGLVPHLDAAEVEAHAPSLRPSRHGRRKGRPGVRTGFLPAPRRRKGCGPAGPWAFPPASCRRWSRKPAPQQSIA